VIALSGERLNIRRWRCRKGDVGYCEPELFKLELSFPVDIGSPVTQTVVRPPNTMQRSIKKPSRGLWLRKTKTNDGIRRPILDAKAAAVVVVVVGCLRLQNKPQWGQVVIAHRRFLQLGCAIYLNNKIGWAANSSAGTHSICLSGGFQSQYLSSLNYYGGTCYYLPTSQHVIRLDEKWPPFGLRNANSLPPSVFLPGWFKKIVRPVTICTFCDFKVLVFLDLSNDPLERNGGESRVFVFDGNTLAFFICFSCPG
jgi:hypothetical protein